MPAVSECACECLLPYILMGRLALCKPAFAVSIWMFVWMSGCLNVLQSALRGWKTRKALYTVSAVHLPFYFIIT